MNDCLAKNQDLLYIPDCLINKKKICPPLLFALSPFDRYQDKNTSLLACHNGERRISTWANIIQAGNN